MRPEGFCRSISSRPFYRHTRKIHIIYSKSPGDFVTEVTHISQGGLKIEVQHFTEVKCCDGKTIQSFEL